MNGQVLCVGGDASRWQSWERNLEENDYTVVHAIDAGEALALLKACSVDVVCIDSQVMSKAGSSVIGAGLRDTRRHVPVVLVQTGGDVPEHFEEHVDVVIDASSFGSVGRWLIEELQEMRFPLFVEWFDEWKQRSNDSKSDSVPVC
jgi:DNA-binding NtrC family response regulator